MTNHLIGFPVNMHQAVFILAYPAKWLWRTNEIFSGSFIGICFQYCRPDEPRTISDANSRVFLKAAVDIKSSRTLRSHFFPFTVHPGTIVFFGLEQKMCSCPSTFSYQIKYVSSVLESASIDTNWRWWRWARSQTRGETISSFVPISHEGCFYFDMGRNTYPSKASKALTCSHLSLMRLFYSLQRLILSWDAVNFIVSQGRGFLTFPANLNDPMISWCIAGLGFQALDSSRWLRSIDTWVDCS